MLDTRKNWLGLVNSCRYYARQTRAVYQVLPYSVGFKALWELYNPLRKTILSKCSFISNKGPVNISNDREAQTCKYFPFEHW